MEKLSIGSVPGLSWDYIADRFVRHGLPAMAVGSGIAGLAHFLSMRKKREEEQESSKNNDTIVIEVPTKQAGIVDSLKGPSLGQYAWDAPMAIGTALAGGGLGYLVVDKILKKYREQQLDSELNSLKKQYAKYLAQDMVPKQASSEYPMLDGLTLAITETAKATPVEQDRKEAAASIVKEAFGPETVGTMALSLPGVAALLSGILAHNYYYNHQKNVQRGLEKEEAEKMKLAPKSVKIVSVPAVSEEPAKSKATKKKNDDVPVDELLGKSAEVNPAAVIPLAAGGAATANNLSSMVQKLIDQGAHVDRDTGANTRESRRKDKIVSREDIQKIDPNTLMLMTDSGPIQIDALDPEALKALEKHKDLILRSFALGMNVK